MSIINRFFNIVKTNIKKDSHFYNDVEHLTQAQWNDLLADDSDDELKNIIDNLNDNSNNINSKNNFDFSDEIRNAFKTLGISETTDINIITVAFKKKIKQYHPDKNNDVSAEEYKQLLTNSADVIKAYNIIKNFLANNK